MHSLMQEVALFIVAFIYYCLLLSMCVYVCCVCPVTGIEIIKAPTWLIHGDQDTVVPPDISLQILQKYVITCGGSL